MLFWVDKIVPRLPVSSETGADITPLRVMLNVLQSTPPSSPSVYSLPIDTLGAGTKAEPPNFTVTPVDPSDIVIP
jgi:hypothetical protein